LDEAKVLIQDLRKKLVLKTAELDGQVPALLEAVQENLNRALEAESVFSSPLVVWFNGLPEAEKVRFQQLSREELGLRFSWHASTRAPAHGEKCAVCLAGVPKGVIHRHLRMDETYQLDLTDRHVAVVVDLNGTPLQKL
jgi:hypothetical protein